MADGAMNNTKLSGGLQNICVYCGSGTGENPAYVEAARSFGRILAASRIGLVYGGGSLGLMGEIARSVLKAGGHVTGVIPGFLSEREHMLIEAQELILMPFAREVARGRQDAVSQAGQGRIPLAIDLRNRGRDEPGDAHWALAAASSHRAGLRRLEAAATASLLPTLPIHREPLCFPAAA